MTCSIGSRFPLNEYLCPPWKRGHIVLQLSVGRYIERSVGPSICPSVDQVLSGQYLLTPSLDQYQTWCRGCPQWVDDPYWFSGHMIKGQGQTTLLSPLCCPLNIFWPLYLINTKLGAGVAPNKWMIPIDFQVTCSKVKVKLLLRPVCCPLYRF